MKERHSHCIEAHKFPSNFRYDVDKKKKTKKDGEDAVIKSYVPKFASFGQGVARGFVRGRGKRRITEVTMTELELALPAVE